MSTLKPDNDSNLNNEIRKIESKTMKETIKDDTKLQDYIIGHNRTNGYTDCDNGQHHFIAVGDQETRQDIIQCSTCKKKLETHLEELRQRRDLSRAEKEAKQRTELAQNRIDELSKKGLEKENNPPPPPTNNIKFNVVGDISE